jgi:thiol-disulfide isomerase/thioredoxin
MRYVAILAVVCLLSVGMSGCISQSGYEFKSGITPPKAVSDLMKNGTVILFITQNNCPTCEQTRPMIEDLQKQYNGTNVTFTTFNIDNNTTSRNVGQVYGVSATPTTVVLRKDGAAAIFVGVFDENIVKSAIEDTRK